MKTEKIITPFNGYLAFVILLITGALIVFGFSSNNNLLGIALVPVFIFLIKGLIVISPNNSKVLLLFGEYKGSIKQNELFWINPLYNRTSLSLRSIGIVRATGIIGLINLTYNLFRYEQTIRLEIKYNDR